MRRSVMVSITILILGAVALLIAARMALKPLEQDVALADEITRLLKQEGDIAEDYRVKVRTKVGDETTLLSEGRGLLVEIRPAEAVINRPRGVRSLVSRVAGLVLDRRGDRKMDWLQFHLHLGAEGAEPFRTALKRMGGGGFEQPVPALPGG